MAKKTAKALLQTTAQHRAVCQDDSFKGRWQDDVNDAYAEGRAHRERPGNEDHVVVVVTRQTTTRLLPD